MADIFSGAFVMVVTVALIAAGYCVHMWHVLKDIAREDAEMQADRMFNSYVRNCEYHVVTQLRIVDEMGRNT